MKILVSACLLGLSCRYDGRSKENPAILRLAADHTLIPYCPEIYGGLHTPRDPSEMRDGRVFSKSGADVTAQFEKGAVEAVLLAKTLGCDCAVLQDKSPSCGVGTVYDGTFTGALVRGDGLTAKALRDAGVRVLAATAAAAQGVCPCPKECRRHEDCAACRKHHRRKLPFCER